MFAPNYFDKIPWEDYVEDEIQGIVERIFKKKGYSVYNLHQVNRSKEKGADLICTKTAEEDKIVISVKIKPNKSSIYQMYELLQREERTKIYIYINEPTHDFKLEMDKRDVKNKIQFWNKSMLTSELYKEDLKLYLGLIIENNVWKDVFNITFSFSFVFFDLKDNEFNKKIKKEKTTPELLKILWNAKDRSTTLYKSLKTLEMFFYNANYKYIDNNSRTIIIKGYLKAVAYLHYKSIIPLKKLFKEIIKKYPGLFTEFCIQTKGRSNWIYFLQNYPAHLPGNIMKFFASEKKYKKMLDEIKNTRESDLDDELDDKELGIVLGDISTILADGAYWLEDTVDDLFSIALFPDYRDIRMNELDFLIFE